MKILVIILACLLSAAGGAASVRYFGRFTIVHLSGQAAYQYDRWTGETWFLEFETIKPVLPPPPPPITLKKPTAEPQSTKLALFDFSKVAEPRPMVAGVAPPKPDPATAVAKPANPYAKFADKDPWAEFVKAVPAPTK